MRLLVDGAESHVHTVLVGCGVLLEGFADAAVLVGKDFVGRSDALGNNLRQNLRTNHAHECARHTVSCTVGGGDDDALFGLGIPIIIAADYVLRTEQYEMVRDGGLDFFLHWQHRRLDSLSVFDGVGDFLVFGSDFFVFLHNQLALLTDFGGALLHDFFELLLVADEFFGVSLHE